LAKPIRIDDVYFGDVEVYFNSVSKEIIWDESIENLNISYQGCNEKGFCYPIVIKSIDVKELDNL
jgi:thiol:disulfide interchange protein